MSGRAITWGYPLSDLFRKRPRILFAEGYVAVWDHNGRNGGTPHVFVVNDLQEFAEWFYAWHGTEGSGWDKRVWIYKVRIEQVWTGTAEELVKEVIVGGQK